MSALAARRATAAAASPKPEQPESSIEEVSVSGTLTLPSPKRRKTRQTSPKRRSKARYSDDVPTPRQFFQATESLAEQRTGRFSPSAPDSDGGTSSSSVGDSDEDMAQEDEFEDRREVDGERDQRKVSVAANMSSSGPFKR